VEKDKVKEISILLGAGFSKSLADLPLASGLSSDLPLVPNLSSDVLKAFKNDSRLKERFENTKEENFNYEKFAQYLVNIRDQSLLGTKLGLDFSRLDDNETEKLNLCEGILYETLLDKLLSVDNAEKFKKRQETFVDLITKLLAEGYKLHFFDLNHDLLLEKLFQDESLKVENFFEIYGEFMLHRGYIQLEDSSSQASLENKFRPREKEIALGFYQYKDQIFNTQGDYNKQIFHYKPHGALNLFYLTGYPTSNDYYREMVGLHLLKDTSYDQIYQNKLNKIFKEKAYLTANGEQIEFQPAILNQGNNKASILTTDFLAYFPEVYSKFISLGEQGVPLLTIGYGFQDSHFNTAIEYHYNKNDSYRLKLSKPKILFSGYEEIPLITDKLKRISVDDCSGLTLNKFGRKEFRSDRNFEDFLAV
jgi:hypothetical protein